MVASASPQTFAGVRIDHVGSGVITLDEVLLPDLQVTLSKTYRLNAYNSRSDSWGFADIPMTAYEPLRLWGLGTPLEPGEYLVYTLSDQGDHQYVVGADPVADTAATSSEYQVNGGPLLPSGAPLVARRPDNFPLDRPALILAHRGEGSAQQVTLKPEALPGFLAGEPGGVPRRAGSEVVWEPVGRDQIAGGRAAGPNTLLGLDEQGELVWKMPEADAPVALSNTSGVREFGLGVQEINGFASWALPMRAVFSSVLGTRIYGLGFAGSFGNPANANMAITVRQVSTGRTVAAVNRRHTDGQVPTVLPFDAPFDAQPGEEYEAVLEITGLGVSAYPLTTRWNASPVIQDGFFVRTSATGAGATFAWGLTLDLGTITKNVIGPLDPADLPGYEDAAPGTRLTRTAGGFAWEAGGGGAGLELSTDDDGFVVLGEPDPDQTPPSGVTVESLIQNVTAALRQPQIVNGFVYASSELQLDTEVDGFAALHLRAPANLETRHVSQWSLGAKDIGIETLRDWAGDLYETPQLNVPLVSGDVLSTAFSLQDTAQLTELLVRLVTTPGLNPFGDVTAEFVLTRSGVELHRASVLKNGVDASGTAGSVTPRAAVDLELIPGDYLLTATITATGAVATRLGAMADPDSAHPQPTQQTGFSTEDFRLRRNGADIGVNFGLAALVSRANLLARAPLTSSPVAGGLALSGDGFVMAAQPLAAPTPDQRVRAAVEFTVTPQAGEHLAFRFLPGGTDALTVDPNRSQAQSVLEAVRGLVPGDAAARPLRLTLATLGLKQSFPSTSVPVDTRLRLELTSEPVGTTGSFTATYRLYNAASGELLGEMSRTTGQGGSLPRPTRLILALTSDLGSGPGTAENNFPAADFGLSDGQYQATSLTLHRWVEWRETI